MPWAGVKAVGSFIEEARPEAEYSLPGPNKCKTAPGHDPNSSNSAGAARPQAAVDAAPANVQEAFQTTSQLGKQGCRTLKQHHNETPVAGNEYASQAQGNRLAS